MNHYRYGIKCSEGKINLQQKTELLNHFRKNCFSSFKEDALKKNGGNSLSVEAVREIDKMVEERVIERSEQIKDLSYKEAKEEVGKLPVSLRQKFELEKILMVPSNEVVPLTRTEASALIDKVSKEMQSKEVSKDILDYAKEYNLVDEDKVYTYKNWNEDSKKVPGMQDLKELAEKLNLQSNLMWRKDNVHNGKFPLDNCQFTHDDYVAVITSYYTKADERFNGPVMDYQVKAVPEVQMCENWQQACQFTHDDYVAVITSYYTKADERFNGPVMDYQVKAVPEVQMCENWQQAEKLYLDRCVVNNLIGEDEARFLLNADRKFVNCPSDKLLDSSLPLEERKAAAIDVKNVIQEKMVQSRISMVSTAYIAPSTEKDLTNAGKCVRYAINQIVGRTDNAADYITPAGKEITMVASAIMYSTPGLVGKPGSNAERFAAVCKTVASVKNSLVASKNNTNEKAKETKVERRRPSGLSR